jgi:thioredoxin reductase (NADPH)
VSGEPEPAFLFLGALPCTGWLDDTAGRNPQGSILTGPAARMDNLLETDVPGLFVASDVRSGSTKRYATAVGEGAPRSVTTRPSACHAQLPSSNRC